MFLKLSMGQPQTITTDPYPIPPVFLSRKIVVIEFVDGFTRSFIDYVGYIEVFS